MGVVKRTHPSAVANSKLHKKDSRFRRTMNYSRRLHIDRNTARSFSFFSGNDREVEWRKSASPAWLAAFDRRYEENSEYFGEQEEAAHA